MPIWQVGEKPRSLQAGNRPALEVLQDAKAYAQTADDPEQAEYFVRVK